LNSAQNSSEFCAALTAGTGSTTLASHYLTAGAREFSIRRAQKARKIDFGIEKQIVAQARKIRAVDFGRF
jgi:hypothetical protein